MGKLTDKLDEKFIDDWRDAWKKFSVLAFAVIAALPEAYEAANALGLFADSATVPENFKWLVRVGALAGIYLRLVRQKAKDEDQADAA